ncbi:hypothetical protein Mag101_10460 [Microbulbifer agarilyticus]|uniref:TonB-dependent receptor plug domain-containing protein n=1 Tax=Microbulbifer agarilyticus TaxID=260552 RepID=A0A1Q2M5P8_9GAMM|nr:TonB-dependent receptor plug domain-containing protein [Microbulbifer agarilyticus]AQQ68011.1 hypothetical protein Mag101_10460 [Microbulbifer agarilyticus]
MNTFLKKYALPLAGVFTVSSPVLGSTEKTADTSELEEVVVTETNQKIVPTEQTAETQRLLSVAGAALDPLQAIYSLPGVTFSSNGFSPEPVIRGSAPQDNAYYVDLIPANYIFHIFGNSIFDKDLIHSFHLHPAAFSSQYGNATGGVIDVSLREPRNQEFTTTLNWSFLQGGAMIESGIGENQAFYASYRRSLMDVMFDEDDLADDDPGFSIDQLPISDDYQLKYQWNINPENSLAIVAAGAGDVLAATFTDGSEEVARDPDFAGPAEIQTGFDSQGVIWNWSRDQRSLRTILSHISGYDDIYYGANQFQNTDSDRFILRSSYTQPLNKAHLLTAGISYESSSFDVDFNAKYVPCADLEPECPTVDADYLAYRDQFRIGSAAMFIEDLITLNARQQLSLGLHISNDNYLGESRVEPRMRWDYQFAENWDTYVALGQYSQLPELEQMVDVLGNPNLTTVKADHYVWGIKQQLTDGWSWGADVYYKNMQDVVISDVVNNYTNDASGRAYGLEFLVNKEITEKWYGWASLSLAKTEREHTRTGETIDFQYDKPVLFNLVLNYRPSENWMFGIKWNYQSGEKYTPVLSLTPSERSPDVLEPVYGTLNSERLPAYHRLDFRAEYTKQKSWGYYKFYADILNAYGQANVEAYEYTPIDEEVLDKQPPGFGPDVPVTENSDDILFPSIGIEVQF